MFRRHLKKNPTFFAKSKQIQRILSRRGVFRKYPLLPPPNDIQIPIQSLLQASTVIDPRSIEMTTALTLHCHGRSSIVPSKFSSRGWYAIRDTAVAATSLATSNNNQDDGGCRLVCTFTSNPRDNSAVVVITSTGIIVKYQVAPPQQLW